MIESNYINQNRQGGLFLGFDFELASERELQLRKSFLGKRKVKSRGIEKENLACMKVVGQKRMTEE